MLTANSSTQHYTKGGDFDTCHQGISLHFLNIYFYKLDLLDSFGQLR